MKRYFTLLLLMLGMTAANAQKDYKVSAAEEKRGILIEEYTGIGCGNCPDGHRVAGEIARGSQGQAHIVSIHTGGFSPSSGDFVLRTKEGDSIAYNFAPDGFPTGMISRHPFSAGKYVYGRGDWASLSNRLMKEIAVVNLYGEAVYDGKTKQLSVHAEGFNPVDNSDKDMRINVMVTQNNIVGPQNGTDGNYNHMHVLRKCITPVSGDAVANKGKGEYFTADYVWDMPDDINKQKLELGNINVVLFVTGDGMSDIINVKEFTPVYQNVDQSKNAELLAPVIPVGTYYGYNYFEADVKNITSEKAQTATFAVTVNGVTEEITQDCSINIFEKGSFKLPYKIDFAGQDIFKYEIALKRINNIDVNANVLSGSFQIPPLVGNDITIKIVTDKSAEENEFLLKDQDGNVVREFGPFKNGKRNEVMETVHLAKGGIYCMEVIDHGGNGMSYRNRGTLNVVDKNDLIDFIDDMPDYGTRVFFRVETELGIDGVSVENTEEGTVYSLSGMVLDKENHGERIVIKNGKKYFVK